MTSRIARVNEQWDQLKATWPQGSGLEYLIAFELIPANEEVVDALKRPEFVKNVIDVARSRGIPVLSALRPPELSRFVPPAPDDTDSDDYDSFDGADGDDDTHSRVPARWTANEVARFIEALREQPPSWKVIARRFPGRTPRHCRMQYKRLRRTGKLDFEYPAQEESHETAMRKKQLTERIHNIIAIHFSYGDQSCLVIPQGQRYRQVAMQNPLVNYIDQITMMKIVFPAISPDYYLLDYTTWLKILATNAENPFTRSHFNKRQLTFITYDNVHLYAHKIVNLVESRPPNPADDKLAEILGQELSNDTDIED
jgi:hypothetical protein